MGNAIPYTQLKSQNPNQDDIEEHQEEETFTCEICIEPLTLRNMKFKNSNRCVHPFCTDCMIKYIQVKLKDNVSDIKCPATTCDHSLDPLSCRPKISHQLFNKWCDVLCESTVLGVNRVYCPNKECSVLILDECGKAWHDGYTCEDSGVTRDENDVAFGVFVETKEWQRCPVCRHCVERFEGCDIISCRFSLT
ncbi:hypothetical protein CTI12_AA276760 [Artemisia annua]|uniref:Zinc finger, RING/FYVE/PHD-type n=1 Tax=Artemisia annua TaxID=35608 RepID=A0A2U1ND95_ARTAN|nr:hypothetical protein CTI12_AA276760 [Artemisia annua]